MTLYLDSFQAALRAKDKTFVVASPSNADKTFAPEAIKTIFLTKGVSVTTDALLLAIAHDIPVVLLDGIGHPVGQVWSGQYGSISTIRQQQAVWSRTPDALIWIKNEIIIPKIEAQLQHLQTLPQIVGHSITVLEKTIAQVDTLKIDTVAGNADILRGYEGIASRHYFMALSQNLPAGFQFKTRSTHPALDAFNAALNYAYGILYAQVEIALLQSGIDPAISVLHTQRHQRPTFVYDCIEPYRVWADAVLMRLCCIGTLETAHFETWQHPVSKQTSMRITAEGKQIIVENLLEYLETQVLYKAVLRRRSTHLLLDAARLATMLKGWSE
jgi:CRISP-associated protein Cas1